MPALPAMPRVWAILPSPLSAPAVVARDVVVAGAKFVHQRGAEGSGPVQHAVGEGSGVKRVIDQRLGVDGRRILAAVGIAAGEIVLGVDLPIQLEIALIGIHEGRGVVGLVEADCRAERQRVKRRGVEQLEHRGAERAERNLVVGERRAIAAGVERVRVVDLDGTVGRIEQAGKIALAPIGGEDGEAAGYRWIVLAQALIVGEEEELVLEDRSAESAAELVPAQQLTRYGGVGVPVIAPVVGVELVVAEVLEKRCRGTGWCRT